MDAGPRRSRIGRLLRACRYSAAGLRRALCVERTFQEEVLVLLALVLPGAFLFGQNGVERALLIGSWGLVLIVELLNTAVERAVDRIGTEPHDLSGYAKDLGSAAVGMTIALAVVVWALVLLG